MNGYLECWLFTSNLHDMSKIQCDLIFPCSPAVLWLLSITRQMVWTVFSISLKGKKFGFTFNFSVWVTSHEMTYSSIYWFFHKPRWINSKSLQLVPSLQIQNSLTVASWQRKRDCIVSWVLIINKYHAIELTFFPHHSSKEHSILTTSKYVHWPRDKTASFFLRLLSIYKFTFT